MKIQIRVSDSGRTFEGEAMLTEVRPNGGPPVKRAQSVGRPLSTKPSGAVDALYHKEFFASEHSLGDVLGQLGRDGYNFSAPSILMALKSREYLQRRGSKGSYRFVQKFPPSS
jgi:hypothetical protein